MGGVVTRCASWLQSKGKVWLKKTQLTAIVVLDVSDVLTDWALAGQGIVMKPIFEIAHHLKSGALVPVATDTPPEPVQMACLFTHRRRQDPKTRLFMDFIIDRIGATVREAAQG